MSNATDTNWFSSFFSGAALDLWRRAIPVEQTEEEVQFLGEVLGLEETSRVLDVPCGNGRLCIPLGLCIGSVVGVDTSDEFIEEANRSALAHQSNCQFLKADMRKRDFKAEFDGAYCMGNSFGYFDKEGTLRFLKAVAASLKNDARFVIDSNMIAESFLVNGAGKEWVQVDGIYMLVENRYNCHESLVETTYTFLSDGKEEKREAIHWIYTAGELCKMLKQSGFEIVELLESTDGDAYSLGSERLLLVAQKS
jgi:SAM-dependent methyltransferase